MRRLRKLVREFLAANPEAPLEQLAEYIAQQAPDLADKITINQLKKIAVRESTKFALITRQEIKEALSGSLDEASFKTSSAGGDQDRNGLMELTMLGGLTDESIANSGAADSIPQSTPEGGVPLTKGPPEITTTSDRVRGKVANFFEFLKQAYCSDRIIRDVSDYETIVFWQADLPVTRGCAFLPGGSDGPWLEVQKQQVPEPPQVPSRLSGWVEDHRNPLKPPAVRPSLGEDVFENDPGRIRAWDQFRSMWEDWARKALPLYQTQELYKKLFQLSLRLEKERERLELIWGHGMLYWRIEGVSVRHPVLTTKMVIEFDEVSGIIRVLPASGLLGRVHANFAMDFLDGLPINTVPKLSVLREEFNSNPIDPWDEKPCFSFYQQLVNLLDPGGVINFKGRNLEPTEEPQISNESVLFVRVKRSGYRQDIEAILEWLKAGRKIPSIVSSIVGDEAEISDQKEDDEVSGDGQEIFFPLPANEEQRRIVERLTTHEGVTVQGPPGTGKSHTIVNIACHLLARGKRVLITAQAERPLRVLRRMFPEEIQPLCVTVLADDTTSLGELEAAVRSMSENVVSLDKEKTYKELEILCQKLRQIREEISTLRWRIKEIAQRESEKCYFMGRWWSLEELAEWVRREEGRVGWIPDSLPKDARLPLTDEELRRLYELTALIRPEDLVQMGKVMPDPDRLPTGMELNELMRAIEDSEEKLAHGESFLAGWEPSSDLTVGDLESLCEDVKNAQAMIKQYEQESWKSVVFLDIAAGGARRAAWENLAEWLNQVRDRLIELLQTVSLYNIALPEDRALAELKDMLAKLVDILGRGSLGLFDKFKYKQILKSCCVDGRSIQNASLARIALAEVERRELLEKLAIRWRKEVVPCGAPELDPTDPRLVAKADDYSRTIREVLQWHDTVWPSVTRRLASLRMSVSVPPSTLSLQELQIKLELAVESLKAQDMKSKLLEVTRYLEEGRTLVESSSLWDELRQALNARSWQKWDQICARIRYLKSMEQLYGEFSELTARLSSAAPCWTEMIVDAVNNGKPLEFRNDILEAWEWRKAETYLTEIIYDNPDVLSERINLLRKQEEKLVRNLISLSTWLGLAERITEEQRKSLIAWQQYVRKIGKGTGKYASYYRARAREEMRKARGAVPVWIMPLYQVVANFPPLEDLFDVVVMDESSQVDLKGVLVFARGRKALVVGDDKQISPYGVGVNKDQIHGLMEQYLGEIAHKELFGPDYSLYDLSKLCFPGVIMLREHFRCLPEIIQFSNDLMYQGEILPLRKKESTFGDDWEPVKAVRVENGFRPPGKNINEPEAECLVDQVVRCCADSRYDGMTMGVISLLSDEQAYLIESMLVEKLGESEIKLRRIICGDAYYFQGDERHIMFLSLVESIGDHRPAVLNKMNDFRRFNVAASRARNQMWLFYSVDPDDLHPEDVRARLIRYCCHPHRTHEKLVLLEEECESEFERRVLRDLVNLGYKVKPQVRVGNYRIDLVVYGINDQLAVECDGEKYHPLDKWEEDWCRQEILERAGWKFYRIRGSAYFRSPQRAISDLVGVLHRMGIRPWRPTTD